MVFYADHRLVARQCGKRGADRGHRFNQTGINAAVDDPVGLVMVRGNLDLGDYFFAGGMDKVDAHGLVPASAHGIERGGKVSVRRSGESGSSGHSGQF